MTVLVKAISLHLLCDEPGPRRAASPPLPGVPATDPLGRRGPRMLGGHAHFEDEGNEDTRSPHVYKPARKLLSKTSEFACRAGRFMKSVLNPCSSNRFG